MARVRRLLYPSAFVRAAATSTAGVTLGAFLAKLDARGGELGVVIVLWRAFRRIKPPEELAR